jgi:hypothetical protein
MSSRTTSTVFCLVLFCLLIPMGVMFCKSGPKSQGSRPEEETITVWKVGPPYPSTYPAGLIYASYVSRLQQQAQRLGIRIVVKTLPGEGFARRFFDAYHSGQEPDVLAINNYRIIWGMASDVRKSLEPVTESLWGFEGPGPLGIENGWEFLVTTSEHSEAARMLALRSPDCRPEWHTSPLPEDLQPTVADMTRAYLQGDANALASFEDDQRLRTEIPDREPRYWPRLYSSPAQDPKTRQVLETKTCGYWGNDQLAFAPAVASYVSAERLGHISVLMVLRKRGNAWKMLAASTDPETVTTFIAGLPKLGTLLQGAQTPAGSLPPAGPLAPPDGQVPAPSFGKRFGDFIWQPNASGEVVAQIVEFAYEDSARLFLRILPRKSHKTDRISEGQLWTTGSEWKWRVWSLSRGSEIAFSDVRSFPH